MTSWSPILLGCGAHKEEREPTIQQLFDHQQTGRRALRFLDMWLLHLLNHADSARGCGSSMLGGSSYFELRTTTYGGRSLFATSDIAPGTRIHSCEFAFVIYKDYRKEVCAQCFVYSVSDNAPSPVGSSRTWSVKWSRAGASTAWFCSDGCKDSWERDEASTLLMEVDSILTKGQAGTRKRFKSPEEEDKVKSTLPVFEPGDRSITQKEIDAAWESADALAASKAHLGYFCSTHHIEDIEFEIARSLAAAIVRRYCDERLASFDVPSLIQSVSWTQFHLQANELCNIQTQPYMLAAYLRIYVFLLNALPKYLKKYLSTVREVLARDTGNAFGIWDGHRNGMGDVDQRELFQSQYVRSRVIWTGYNQFVLGCMPNVQKKRVGRTLHFETIRRVENGRRIVYQLH